MDWLGGSWSEIGRVVLSTAAIYITAIVSLRVAGRRTVSQMSAFDFVVTIAIGSLVAMAALSPQTNYVHGAAALLSLIALQQVFAVVRTRFEKTRRFLDFSPQRIFSNGHLNLRKSPLTAQLTEWELHSKLRRHGVKSLDDVAIVVLEDDGSISILKKDADGSEPPLWREI